MKPGEILKHLLAGIRADHAAYEALRELLESQFRAALRHDTAQMQEVGERISQQVTAMDERRRQRLGLVETFGKSIGAKKPLTMRDVLAKLAQGPRETAERWWGSLETQLQQCQALNARNCHLITEQQATMQRVLEGELDTYEPA